jgi:hypothetical protein
MNVETTPAPSAPTTSQATPAERVVHAERALARAIEDQAAAAARSARVEAASAVHVAACQARLQAARVLAMPPVVALEELPRAARSALVEAADRRARALASPDANRAELALERARALAHLAGVEVTA